MRIFRDSDADIGLVRGRKVAIVGYGSQGRAHALNLRDSGVSDLAIALREGSASARKAADEGFRVVSNADAARWADIVMMLTPDENQARIWADEIAPHIRDGAAIAFAHGLNVHFGLIEPGPAIDVVLIAPKGPGRAVRAEYRGGGGIPCLIAVHQDASGNAHDIALSYACAIGGGRSGIIETTFREECETDLFGEQAVLCGGLPQLVQAGFETLVDAGYAPEMAYFECIHEVKLIADLIYERGLAAMRHAISNTAEFGGTVTGPRIVTEQTRAEMRRVLADIQNGRFVSRFVLDDRAGRPELKAARNRAAGHASEAVGARLRAMMPWIGEAGAADEEG